MKFLMKKIKHFFYKNMFLQKNNFDFMVCMMEKNVDIKKAQPSTKIYVSYNNLWHTQIVKVMEQIMYN